MNAKRETWIDGIKAFACVLVVLGHFFQSMVRASILPDNGLYQWFNTTIYYFHVPLFFICSGYLYQKYSRVDRLAVWKRNVCKKAVVLGVPYFVFSFATWALKTVFSGEVNSQIGGLGDTLLVHPASPYWFLYILFLIFVITPTVKTKAGLCLLTGIALGGKVLTMVGGGGYGILQIYAVSQLLANWIWFVLGMAVAFGNWQTYFSRTAGIALGIAFVTASVWTCKVKDAFLPFGMGLAACAAVFMAAYNSSGSRRKGWFARYTMPVFLMHTLFAAPCRVLLMKLGIGNAVIQVSMGLAISFAGPMAAAALLEKLKPLDFVVFPGRYIRFEQGFK